MKANFVFRLTLSGHFIPAAHRAIRKISEDSINSRCHNEGVHQLFMLIVFGTPFFAMRRREMMSGRELSEGEAELKRRFGSSQPIRPI
jgi:hypothetical protein